jgi:hypothetical protein
MPRGGGHLGISSLKCVPASDVCCRYRRTVAVRRVWGRSHCLRLVRLLQLRGSRVRWLTAYMVRHALRLPMGADTMSFLETLCVDQASGRLDA